MTTGLQVSGWCIGTSPGRCSVKCPRVFEAMRLPDPARAGTFYTTQRRECECPCHNRVGSEML